MKVKEIIRGKFVRGFLPKPVDYFLNQGIEITGNGDWRSAICPFHNDKNPSLRIHKDIGAFRCMSCGARGGGVLDFHMQKYGLSFAAACIELGVWRNV